MTTKFNPQSFLTKELGRIQIDKNEKSLFYALEMTRRYILGTGNSKLKIPILLFLGNNTLQRQWRREMKNTMRQHEYAMELFNVLQLENENAYGIQNLAKIQKYYDEIYPEMFRIIAFDKIKGLKPVWKAEVN